MKALPSRASQLRNSFQPLRAAGLYQQYTIEETKAAKVDSVPSVSSCSIFSTGSSLLRVSVVSPFHWRL